jgi:hypothetical protein
VSQQHSLAGPYGTVTINGRSFPLVAWSITEGDPFGPDGARGWFRCNDPAFTAKPMTDVHLEVAPWEGDYRTFPAKITGNVRDRQVWQFRVDRTRRRASPLARQNNAPG